MIHLILHLPATATKKAAASDNLQDTINYAAVLNEVKAAVEAKRYNLIETVAEDCATIILQAFPVQQVDVNVIKKPKEIMAQLDYVAVNISRQK